MLWYNADGWGVMQVNTVSHPCHPGGPKAPSIRKETSLDPPATSHPLPSPWWTSRLLQQTPLSISAGRTRKAAKRVPCYRIKLITEETSMSNVGRPGLLAQTAKSPLGSNRAGSAPSSTMRLYPSLLSVRLLRKPAVCITSCSSMSGPNAVHVLNPICNGHTRSQASQAPDDDHGTMQSASTSYDAAHGT